jgi:hypothetical protein
VNDGGLVAHVDDGEAAAFGDGEDLVEVIADEGKDAVDPELEGAFDE